MANRYAELVVGNNNWSDIGIWKATTGGATGASKPTSADNVFVNADSVQGGGATLTIDEAAFCLDMDWTGATDTPTLAGSSTLDVRGSLTFITAMTQTYTGTITFSATSSGKTITTGGMLACALTFFGASGGWILQDEVNIGSKQFRIERTSLDTNGNNISCGNFNKLNANAFTLTLGTSVVTCLQWFITNPLTLNAGTSTIRVTATGAFSGNGAIYINVELNGTAHTISGDNTFKLLKIGRAAAVTITGTAASTQTVTTLLLGNTINVVTLDSTGAAWTIQGNRGYFEGDYMDIADVVCTEANLYYAGDHSTDSTGNTNWTFTRKVRPGLFSWRR